MGSVNMLAEKSSVELIEKADPARLVFGVGSGVDHLKPSCLPLGDGLRKAILQLSVGERYAAKINKEWDRIQKRLKPILNGSLDLAPEQRLETTIECIRLFESCFIDKKYSVLKGFSSFQEVPINNNHFVLADYLSRGANIVTTNYDDCIAKAFYVLSQGKKTLELAYNDPGSSLYVYASSDKSSGSLYYIHGAAAFPSRIGISLSSIKDGLCDDFIKQLKTWIDNDSIFVYMGYSGSDSLDVNPILQSLSPAKSSSGLFIRYQKEAQDNSLEGHPTNAKEDLLLRPFKEKYLCPCDTDDLFLKLGDYHALVDAELAGRSNFNWEDAFKSRITEYPDEYQKILVLSVLHTIHLNSKKVVSHTPFIDADQFENIERWYINYFGFRLAQQRRNLFLMHRYTAKALKKKKGSDEQTASNKWFPLIYIRKLFTKEQTYDAMISEYYTSLGLGLKAVDDLYFSPSEMSKKLETALRNNAILGWTYSTAYNRFFRNFLVKITLHPSMFHKLRNQQEKDIDALLADLKKIVDIGYPCVEEANQINTALRTLGLALVLFRNDYTRGNEFIKQALTNYANTTYLHGISGTYVYSSYAYCLEYIRTRKKECRESAFREFRLAYKVSRFENDRTMPRVLLANFWFLIISPFLSRYI